MATYGLVFVLGLLGALGMGVAGLVLFIVGLVNKRPALWGTGIVLGIVAMTAVVVCVGFVFYGATRSMQTMMSSQLAYLTAAAAATEADFEAATGVALPPEASVIYGGSSADYSTSDGTAITTSRIVKVPDSFAEVLAGNFTSATWDDVKPYLSGEGFADNARWDLTDSPTMAYYTKIPAEPSTTASPDYVPKVSVPLPALAPTYIAYDRANGVMYVAIVAEISMVVPLSPTAPADSDPWEKPTLIRIEQEQ